jgi:EcsC family protein
MSTMSEEDLGVLRRAQDTLENPGLAAKISNLIGLPLERAMKHLPNKWLATVHRATQHSLMIALDAALATIETQRFAPKRNGLHRLIVAGTGAVGGAFGLTALAVELPISTMVMLRSISDIARSQGESLHSLDTKLACIEVFALGGRSESDDASESGYFAIRAALAGAVADAARHFTVRGGARQGAPALVRLIGQIANRFGVVVTQKAAAQAVPVIGAAGGAAVNVLFMHHFQDMAWGHFTVRRLERKYGSEVVRSAYQGLRQGRGGFSTPKPARGLCDIPPEGV